MTIESKTPQEILQELFEKTGYLIEARDGIQKAYYLADSYHEGQKRKSGDPYITHPLHVAILLTELEVDLPTIQAAILHDTVEDTSMKPETISKHFDDDVLKLVMGMTKLSRVEFKSNKEQKIENIRKMLLAMATDIRVVLIKLADRLHNMQSISIFSRKKQLRIASETMDIYVPLASRLGIYKFKWQLEDLCFRYLEADTYRKLSRDVDLKRSERDELVKSLTSELVEILEEAEVKGEVSGRAKNLHSIYKKMRTEGKNLDEIFDLHAIRILVKNIPSCYRVLGYVHARWKPLPGRIKDYIAIPKTNGYQSLHTTVVGPGGHPVEIQIRTYQMHDDAEYGIAAHWKYKEGKKTFDTNYEQKLTWLRQLLEWQRELGPSEDFIERVKSDIFSDEVLVFTPKGDIINLPAGANPIDFAYRIHTEVGHSCIGAKVNDRIVPLSYRLKTGDRVRIRTSKNVRGPSRDWLSMVASHSTKSKIRSWFKKALEISDLPAENDKPKPKGQRRRKPIRVGRAGAMVELDGIDNSPVILARCCNPIFGDDIIGFITRGRGVSIHRKDCPNVKHLAKDENRFVTAGWVREARKAFIVRLTIIARNRTGVLAMVSGVISEIGIDIQMAKTSKIDSKKTRLILALEVVSKKELQDVIIRLEQLDDIIQVKRH
jgi:GTP diphosphokinase / guanosine-3',5'-bis(diphosphate) 3'-diphosphatase